MINAVADDKASATKQQGEWLRLVPEVTFHAGCDVSHRKWRPPPEEWSQTGSGVPHRKSGPGCVLSVWNVRWVERALQHRTCPDELCLSADASVGIGRSSSVASSCLLQESRPLDMVSSNCNV